MKKVLSPIIIYAAAAVFFGVNAQEICNPCPDGIPQANLNKQTIPGKTCADLKTDAIALNIPANDPTCNRMKESEETCCPEGGEEESIVTTVAPIVTTATPTEAASTECSVCSGRVIPPENENIPITSGGKTCSDLLIDKFNPNFAEGTDVCNKMKESEERCCPDVVVVTTTPIPTTTAAAVTTTAAATTTEAPETPAPTPAPTLPQPTVTPTKRPTSGPTSRDQLFGNVPTPTITPDENATPPTPPPTTPQTNPVSSPTYEPTKLSSKYSWPTYSPTYSDDFLQSGNGRQPPPLENVPGWTLKGDDADATSGAVSAKFQLTFASIFVLGVSGLLLV